MLEEVVLVTVPLATKPFRMAFPRPPSSMVAFGGWMDGVSR